jgi:drug/metabolite transporter (DMT)-like permease
VIDSANSKDSKSFGPFAALLAVQLLFGSLPAIAKPILNVIPSSALVGIRVLIVALLLLGIQAYRRRIWLNDRGDYFRLAVLGLFGVVLNQLLFIGGLSFTKASNVSLLVVTIPIFTLLVGAVVGSERLSLRKIAGIVVAAAGAIILIDPRNASFSSDTTLGDTMIILNSLAFGIYVATSKQVVTRNGAFRSMMWVFIFSAILCTPLAVCSLNSVEVASVSTGTWFVVVYISIFATAVPYLLNAYAIKRVSPSFVAVFIYLQPIIGFILAAAFLNEHIDVRFLIATVGIFAGVFLVTRNRSAVVNTGDQ